MPPKTEPIHGTEPNTAARLTIAPSYTDPISGATYVHQDLKLATLAWEVEAHISPINRKERFGDVESWATYVLKYGASLPPFEPLLTWSEVGLRAVIDYHVDVNNPGRCQWLAIHDFARSVQWNRWALLANGQARGQKAVLEALEDYAEDIAEPSPAELLAVLRTLRATASATADTELLADGSTKVVWQKQTGVKAGEKAAEMNLPPEFLIKIPVLKGHTEEKSGQQVPVYYALAVRLRASVDDQAHLTFRLSIPNADRVLEETYQDHVEAAKALLGDGYTILRAAER